MNSAVKLLTLDANNKVDHKGELIEAAKLLNKARDPKKFVDNTLDNLKMEILESKDIENLIRIVRNNEEAKNIFQDMELSSTLEDFLQLCRSGEDSPLKTFPPDINQNIYHQIVKFALAKSETTVLFLLNLFVEKDKPVSPDDVIQLAFLFSTLAHGVSRDNKALVKL